MRFGLHSQGLEHVRMVGTLAGLPGWAECAKGSQSGDPMHFFPG